MERSKLLDLYNDRKDPSINGDIDLRSSGAAESSDNQAAPNMYRGWKKSEGALKKKKREVTELKDRVMMLQESHDIFRAQMKTLESVKELSLQLQNQNSQMKKENTVLKNENRALKELNQQAEEVIKMRCIDEEKQSKMLQEMHQGLFVMRGRYEELDTRKRELEKICTDEMALRKSTELKLVELEDELDEFKNQHRELQTRYDQCNLRLNQCSTQLITASQHMNNLKKDVDVVVETKEKLATTSAEVHVLKGDLARMVRLLEQYPDAKNFIDQWGDSHGLSFVGTTNKKKVSRDELNIDNWAVGTKPELSSYVTNKENQSNNRNSKELSSAEFDVIKQNHSGDPFPLTQSLEEEEMAWVPHEAHKIGIEFLSTKLPHTPTEVIMDFLRRMNKVWMRREKRKIDRVRREYDDLLAEYRRKLAQNKPYRGVIAEKVIERLQTQVKTCRKKHNSGRPKKSSDTLMGDIHNGNNFDEIDHLDLKDVPPHHRRLCQLEAMKTAQKNEISLKRSESPNTRKSNIGSVSTEKLLESSLLSLEKMGQQMTNQNCVRNHEMELIRQSLSHEGEAHPSEAYIRGALWLGRNCCVLVDEMFDSIETLKCQHLSDLSNAVNDPELNRAVSRLHLSGTSMITDVVTTAARYKIRCKDILKDASRLVPGRKDMLDGFMSTLPIDSVSSHK